MSKNTYNLKVGILGGGQLARMLALKGHELGLQMHIMSTQASDPAALVCARHFAADLDDKASLRAFLSKTDIVTFESEFLNAPLLQELSKTCRTRLLPSPRVMAQLQDRWTQKKLLERFKVPTARFVKVDTPIKGERLFEPFPSGFVLKKRLFGYDGYGTFPIKDQRTFRKALPHLTKETVGFIAEEYISFRRELAVTYARSRQGQIVAYPLVESYQENSQCLWVKGPVTHRGFARIDRQIKKLLNSINYVGVIAFEFFETSAGKLMVNEVAPRVHNSSHYSLNGFNCDQFSLHLRAICGMTLPQPKAGQAGFAMYNLLGTGKKRIRWDLPPDVQLHWYAKQENRKNRKMGHINTQDRTPSLALNRLKRARKAFAL